MGDLNELMATTRNLLEPLISKPRLADKLLSKPPFRFLHDIISNLTTATGFAQGLYTEFELDSANITDKTSKIDYLNKIIICVGLCNGKAVDVRATKIVAGLEVENTNLFLQALGNVARMDSTDAVRRTLAGEQPKEKEVSTPYSVESKVSEEWIPSDEKGTNQATTRSKSNQGKREHAEEKESPSIHTVAVDKEDDKRERVIRSREKNDSSQVTIDSQAKYDSQVKTESSSSNNNNNNNNNKAESSSSSSSIRTKSADDKEHRKKSNTVSNLDFTTQIGACNEDMNRTKEVLEKLISRPKLSEKLLGKPPFRFLHDIITEVTKVTGFAEGLFEGDELDSALVKDKVQKVTYLEKIISCVSCFLNVPIAARSAKIVAGLEAEQTNKFLQLLAVAAGSGQSSALAVQQVLSGTITLKTPPNPTNPKTSVVPTLPIAAERKETISGMENETKMPTTSRKPSSTLLPNDATPRKGETDSKLREGFDLNMEKGGGHSNNDDDDHVAEPKRTARPTTARRRPPKLKESVHEVERSAAIDAKTAPPTGIMQDGDNQDSEEEEQQPQEDVVVPHVVASKLDGAQHGKLLRNILQEQSKQQTLEQKKGDEEDTKEQEGGIRFGKRKKSDKKLMGSLHQTEVNQLRNAIQTLCQATNPLGKCMEYVQEDMEAMGKEMAMWRAEYKKKCELYEEELKKTEEALRPLRLSLVETDEQIKEQVQKINSVKASIGKNETRIQQLLRMVVSA